MEKKVIDTLDLSSDIIKRLEEKEEELKEVDDTKDEKKKEVKLFYQLNDEIRELEDKRNIIIESIYNNDLSDDNEKCIRLVKEFLNMEQPSREIAVRLIKRIELHQDKTIDIYFNFKELNFIYETHDA